MGQRSSPRIWHRPMPADAIAAAAHRVATSRVVREWSTWLKNWAIR